MHLASFPLPDINFNSKGYFSCCDCFSPGDRVVITPPLSQQDAPSLKISNKTCCLFCTDISATEDKDTWVIFRQYLTACYGEKPTELALSQHKVDLSSALKGKKALKAKDYQTIKRYAEYASKNQPFAQDIFKLAKFKVSFDQVAPAFLKPIKNPEDILQKASSITIDSESSNGSIGLQHLSPDMIREDLRQLPLTRPLLEADIERITLMVLEDMVEAKALSLKKYDIINMMLRYLKALGFSMKTFEYYEEIAPLALKTLHKQDIQALSTDEYAAYLKLASSLIKKRNGSHSSFSQTSSDSDSEVKMDTHVIDKMVKSNMPTKPTHEPFEERIGVTYVLKE